MHSRSDDPVAVALSRAARLIVDDVRAVGARAPVVLIDGRSGAGKSTLARMVVDAWPSADPVQLIAMDSIYPGWDGLDGGVTHALETILRPHSLGASGAWSRWDWEHDTVAERHAVDPARAVLVEGSGILTPSTAPLADVRVWVESNETSRKSRALARDGDTYRPHWDRWARQEQTHLDRDDPRRWATRVVEVP